MGVIKKIMENNKKVVVSKNLKRNRSFITKSGQVIEYEDRGSVMEIISRDRGKQVSVKEVSEEEE